MYSSFGFSAWKPRIVIVAVSDVKATSFHHRGAELALEGEVEEALDEIGVFEARFSCGDGEF